MARLSDLKLTPEMMAEREALAQQRRERVNAIAASVAGMPMRPGRSDLHALLDACLDLMELDQAGGASRASWPGSSEAKEAARSAGRLLVRGALGWTEPDAPYGMGLFGGAAGWASFEQTPEIWRDEVADRLERAPHLLPHYATNALVRSLRALNEGNGEAPPLLIPFRENGRGANPSRAREAEKWAWMWIYMQKGSGRRIADAVAEVAQAVGRSTDAVQKWREQWEARETEHAEGDAAAGKRAVKRQLEQARALGAQNGPQSGARTLQGIAEQWTAATRPR
jgi:hypothetical protein